MAAGKAHASHDVSKTQEVSEKQSLDVVKIIIFSSISCLSYLRDFVPDYCSDEIYFSMAHPISYEEFAQGRQDVGPPSSQENQEQRGRGTRTTLRILRRGRNPNANVMLDWLEGGVFDALELGYLRALQLNIVTSRKAPEEVLESYTFSFAYGNASKSDVAMEMTVNTLADKHVSVKVVKHSLHNFMRQVSQIIGWLPILPDRRYLSLNIFYTAECPPDYQPKYFQASSETTLKFPQAERWKLETDFAGCVHSGHHTTAMGVTFLNKASNEGANTPTGRPYMPVGMPHTVERAIDADIKFRDWCVDEREPPAKGVPVRPSKTNLDAHDIRDPSGHLSMEAPARSAQPRTISSSKAATVPAHNQVNVLSRHVQDAQSLASDAEVVTRESQVSTQTRQDLQIRSKLRGKMKPLIEDNSMEETQRVERESDVRDDLGAIFGVSSKLQFSQAKLTELKSKKRESTLQTKPITESEMDSDIIDEIKCQCGRNVEEGELIGCDYCNTWQHSHCYGYIGQKDPREPEQHVCYSCLVGKEPSLLKELKTLVLFRNAIRVLRYNGGLTTKSGLMDELQCDSPSAEHVIKTLRREQYLFDAPATTTRRRSSQDRNRLSMILVANGPAYEKMIKEYFDPSTKIAHHLVSVPPQDVTPSLVTQTAGDAGTELTPAPDPAGVPETQVEASQETEAVAAPANVLRPRGGAPAVRDNRPAGHTRTPRPKDQAWSPLESATSALPGPQQNVGMEQPNALLEKTPKRTGTEAFFKPKTPQTRTKRMRMSRTKRPVNVSWAGISPGQRSCSSTPSTPNEL